MRTSIYTMLIALVIAISSVHAEPVQLTLDNGKVWQGEIGQTVIVEYEDRGKRNTIEGELSRATDDYIVVAGEFIFIDSIIGLRPDNEIPATDIENVDEDESEATSTESTNTKTEEATTPGDLPRGVFLLPMEQMVGTYFRPQEIRELVAHIDKNYGPGQIIVLEIDSGGGSVRKWSEIRDVVFEARKKHRIVAWITRAISGAAATGFVCDENYYKTTGELGSITMYSGHIDNVSPDWQLEGWIDELEGVLAKTSRTPLVAGCMVRSRHAFSYDVDKETGEITYYDDTSGEFVLSDRTTNLTMGSAEALHSGLSDGTADTKEELAALLDLDEWVELDPYGVDIANEWWDTLKEFEELFPELRREFQGDVEGNTPRARINNQIKAGQEMLKWVKKLGPTGEMMGLDEGNIDRIKRAIENLKHQLQLLDD